jgi:flagellar biogenesis protein FliO
MEWLIAKTVLSLGLVLGLMFALGFVLKKYVYRAKGGRTDALEIEVLGQRMLQPRRSIYAVRVMDTIVVLGMTEHGMHMLTELSGPEVAANLAARQAAAEASAAGGSWWAQDRAGVKAFASHLQKAMGIRVSGPQGERTGGGR